jgi:hypothetical protein
VSREARVSGAALLAAATLFGAAACGGTSAPRPAPTPATPAAAPRPLVRPGDAQYRFEVVRTSDSTFAFLAPSANWLTAGQRGIVVDPRRRDALIARFQALTRRADTVIALVTGQTTDLSTSHVVLLPYVPPRVPGALRRRSFWIGLLTGGALGAGAAIFAR